MRLPLINNRIIFNSQLDMSLVLRAGCDRLLRPRVCRPQTAEGFVVIYLENGEVNWVLEGEKQKFSQIGGTGLLIQPGTTFYAETNLISAEKIFWFQIAPDPSAVAHTCFNSEELALIIQKFKASGNILFKASEDLSSYYSQLARSAAIVDRNKDDKESLWKMRLIVNSVILETMRCLSRNDQCPGEIEHVEKAKQFFQDNLTESINVNDLARFLGVSVTWITKLFLSQTGMAPAQFLRRQRIKKALELLRTTEKSITEITHEIGLSSSQELCRLIRKYTNLTPSEYRNQAKC